MKRARNRRKRWDWLHRYVGGRIREERNRIGLSQSRLADDAGVLRTSLCLAEKGHGVSLEMMAALAAGLGISTRSLLP